MLDLDAIDRLELAVLPTPIQFCRRLTEDLEGPRIYVKRDDLTGAGGSEGDGGQAPARRPFLHPLPNPLPPAGDGTEDQKLKTEN
jgi:hypothetical protein